MVAGIAHQSAAGKPIGEGEVFTKDAERASRIVAQSGSVGDGVRHARNDLDIEAVSVVDEKGVVVTSTSASLTGKPISSPLLEYGISNDRLAALAGPLPEPLHVDSVVEWPAGSVLYQVLSPMDGNGFTLLYYDVAELLGRRTQPGDIEPLTLQLLALGGVFLVLGGAVFIGHTRVVRRHREMTVESDVLRKHYRELEEANEKLARARERAERALALAKEKMRIRSEFVLMINHELRTPLTSVVTGAEVLQDDSLDGAERREIVESMVAQGKRLNEIVEQILAVARMENRGVVYDMDLVPLQDACKSVGVAIDGTTGVGDQVAVQTDIPTLGVMVDTLVDNARTHGASRVVVECGLSPAIDPMTEVGTRPPRSVFFTVRDDGPGIDHDFLPRAFEKFEKNSLSSGTGLGLYMVRLMIDALGGAVGVRTGPGGTTFQIALPAHVDEKVMEPI